jgi:hypothetical protein
MKSIDVKSLLIGFLLCATFFLSVGAVSGNDGIGRYQLCLQANGSYKNEAILDTRTGRVVSRISSNSLYHMNGNAGHRKF